MNRREGLANPNTIRGVLKYTTCREDESWNGSRTWILDAQATIAGRDRADEADVGGDRVTIGELGENIFDH